MHPAHFNIYCTDLSNLHQLTYSPMYFALKSEMGSPDWNKSMVDIYHCGCTALVMPEWREMTKQIYWLARQPSHSQVAFFSGDLKCWGAWDTTRGHKAKDITPLNAWKRETWKEEALDSLPWKDERRPLSIKHWNHGVNFHSLRQQTVNEMCLLNKSN